MSYDQHSVAYNRLLDVRDASLLAECEKGRKILHSLLNRIADAALDNQIGIRLLHKHNNLKDGEWMRERCTQDETGIALITTAEACACAPAHPNSWMLREAGAIPIEFSDANLLAVNDLDQEARSLFSDLADIVVRSGFSHIFGPCAQYSKVVDDLKPSETSALLEKTDYAERSNVLRFVERDSIDFRSSVETKWSAKRGRDSCGNPIWLTTCTCFCSVPPEGGHTGTTTHRYESPDPDPPDPESLIR